MWCIETCNLKRVEIIPALSADVLGLKTQYSYRPVQVSKGEHCALFLGLGGAGLGLVLTPV